MEREESQDFLVYKAPMVSLALKDLLDHLDSLEQLALRDLKDSLVLLVS